MAESQQDSLKNLGGSVSGFSVPLYISGPAEHHTREPGAPRSARQCARQLLSQGTPWKCGAAWSPGSPKQLAGDILQPAWASAAGCPLD